MEDWLHFIIFFSPSVVGDILRDHDSELDYAWRMFRQAMIFFVRGGSIYPCNSPEKSAALTAAVKGLWDFAVIIERKWPPNMCTLNIRLIVVHTEGHVKWTGNIWDSLEFWVERRIKSCKDLIGDTKRHPEVVIGNGVTTGACLDAMRPYVRDISVIESSAEPICTVRTKQNFKDDFTAPRQVLGLFRPITTQTSLKSMTDNAGNPLDIVASVSEFVLNEYHLEMCDAILYVGSHASLHLEKVTARETYILAKSSVSHNVELTETAAPYTHATVLEFYVVCDTPLNAHLPRVRGRFAFAECFIGFSHHVSGYKLIDMASSRNLYIDLSDIKTKCIFHDVSGVRHVLGLWRRGETRI